MIEGYQAGENVYESNAVAADIDVPGSSQATIAVLRHAALLTPIVIAEHPEVAGLYMNTDLTQTQIASLVLPDEYELYPSSTQVAVHDAIREILLPEERAEATLRRRKAVGATQIRRGTDGEQLDDEQFREKQAQLSRARQSNPLTRATKDTALPMIEANGLTPVSDAEAAFARFLKTQPDFRYQNGSHKGQYNSSKIADALNQAFHRGKQVRKRSSVNYLLSPANSKRTNQSANQI